MKVGDVVQLKSGGPNMTIEGFIMEEDAKKINQGYKLFMEMRKTN